MPSARSARQAYSATLLRCRQPLTYATPAGTAREWLRLMILFERPASLASAALRQMRCRVYGCCRYGVCGRDIRHSLPPHYCRCRGFCAPTPALTPLRHATPRATRAIPCHVRRRLLPPRRIHLAAPLMSTLRHTPQPRYRHRYCRLGAVGRRGSAEGIRVTARYAGDNMPPWEMVGGGELQAS